jgi:twinkle protein
MNLFPAGSSKMVTVVEGEEDAMAAYQMLSQGSGYTNPVVSLPSASPSGKLWERTKGWLDSFEKIILSLDNDEPGRKVAERISLMFPGKVRVMDHGQYKDANEFLQAGKQREYKNAWWAAKPYRPDDMLVDPEDYLSLYEESPDFEYFETGIPELDEKILGVNKGYLTVIQAPTGCGKTEVMRYLENRCLKHSGYKFACMHLEESKLRSILGLVSYDLGDNLTLKKFIDEKGRDEDVKESIKRLSLEERMLQFSFNPEDGYESLLDKIKFMKAAFDVDYVFFEPIQDLVHGEDKEGKLADLSSRLGTMATELDVGIVTIAHQNQQGDTLYATMIGKKAAFELVLNRDQNADDLEERNRTYIRVGRKNRVGLGNGNAGSLDFDPETFTLKPTMPPQEPQIKGMTDDF